MVSLEAIKMTPNPNIEMILPEKRNCYFDYEYPLQAHQQYSYVRQLKGIQIVTFILCLNQASCILECHIDHTLTKMSDIEKCIPWYFPPISSDIRLCSPFEARNFTDEIDKLSNEICMVNSNTLFSELIRLFYEYTPYSIVCLTAKIHFTVLVCQHHSLGGVTSKTLGLLLSALLEIQLCIHQCGDQVSLNNSSEFKKATFCMVYCEIVITFSVSDGTVPSYVSNEVEDNRRVYTINAQVCCSTV